MSARADQRRLRSRRRRRRVVRGLARTAFWTLLVGVFVLGIGYGKTLSGEDELRSVAVTIITITAPRDAVQATLPTRTVTVTRTVPQRPKARARASAGAAAR
jgi:hypothetical protein